MIHPIYAVAVTRDGQFAACGRGNRISIYHLPSGQLVAQLVDPKLEKNSDAAHLDLVQSLDFSPDGQLLASGAFREVKLWRRIVDANKVKLIGITNAVIDFSPDGRWVAMASGTNRITIRDAMTGSERQQLSSVCEEPKQLQFSPDGNWLAGVCTNGGLELWDANKGKSIYQTNLASAVEQIAWSASNQLALATAANSIEVFKIQDTGTQSVSFVKTLKGRSDPITAIAGLGNRIVSAQTDGSIRVWDLDQGKELHEFKHGAYVTALAISPDGKRIASGGSNNVVRLWSADGKPVADLKGDRYAEEAMQAAERMATLASNDLAFRKSGLQGAETERSNQVARVTKAGATNDILEKIFVEKKKGLETTVEQKAAATKVVVDLRGEWVRMTNSQPSTATNNLAAASAKTNVDLVSTNAPAAKTNIDLVSTNSPSSTNSVEKILAALKEKLKQAEEKLTASSNSWATAEKEFKKAELAKSIAAHELELARAAEEKAGQATKKATSALAEAEEKEKKQRSAFESLKTRAASLGNGVTRLLAFSADNRLIASAGDDSSVYTWTADTGSPVDVYHPSKAPLRHLAFSSNKVLQGESAEARFRWKIMPSWKFERLIGRDSADSPFADRVNAVRFHPDGRLLATGGGEPSRSGEIKLWSIEDGKLARDLPSIHSDTVFAIDFSPDGKLIASGGADKFMRVSSLDTGKLVKSFEGHTHHVLGVAWKQDGRTLATAGGDSMVKTWNVSTAERLKNIEGFGKEATSICFVGVTDRLLVSAGDGQLKLVRENGEGASSLTGESDFIYSAAATPDGKVIVAGGQDGVLRVWNGRDAKPVAEFGP
jgi:WD40 repeat protein